MKLIYVASPYAGDIGKNTEYAKKACRNVMDCGYAFFAPHLLYLFILNDGKSAEGKMGMEMDSRRSCTARSCGTSVTSSVKAWRRRFGRREARHYSAPQSVQSVMPKNMLILPSRHTYIMSSYFSLIIYKFNSPFTSS